MTVSTRPEKGLFRAECGHRPSEVSAISRRRGAVDELVVLLVAEPGAWARPSDDHSRVPR